jgi:D-alanyl-lipoteichoic acid acyltransferase DltB (MBOAT superfamily)
MSFASIPFFVFLPLVFCLHWLSSRKAWQNGVLLLASYFFYGWWDYRFCLLMLASSLIDYFAGWWIDVEPRPAKRKVILVVSLCASLGVLGFFKYFNFFADSLAIALAPTGLDVNLATMNIVLPVGISFYTFQTMSYTLDIYFGKCRANRNLVEYLAFVSFFPQLVAGPIERATALLPQFRCPRAFSLADAREGCRLILWGLAKKMTLADNLAVIVNRAYSVPAAVSGAELLLGTFCFSFQIYCDFSAYSDIAVGAAKLFGVQLRRNFAYPYFAQSVSEFWRRWHISLSTWFRDYLFIPLGGSRGGRLLTARNLGLTALISGLWHGAAWHFVAWGALHGFYLVAERALRRHAGPKHYPAVPGGEKLLPRPATVLRMGFVFVLVSLAWVLFRANSLADALAVYRKIAVQVWTPGFYVTLAAMAWEHRLTLGLVAAFVGGEWFGRRHWNTLAIATAPTTVRWAIYTVLFWLIVCFGTKQTQDFIYFRF